MCPARSQAPSGASAGTPAPPRCLGAGCRPPTPPAEPGGNGRHLAGTAGGEHRTSSLRGLSEAEATFGSDVANPTRSTSVLKGFPIPDPSGSVRSALRAGTAAVPRNSHPCQASDQAVPGLYPIAGTGPLPWGNLPVHTQGFSESRPADTSTAS